MMHVNTQFRYADGDGWQAVELPYWGGPSMLIIVPDEGEFTDIEQRLDAELLETIDRELQDYTVDLRLPRWESSSDLELVPPLESLGVELLFDDQNADLSGIADVEQLYVSRVLHEANITLDEEGTEAAAATAVVVSATSGPPPPATLTVDRPFIYLIRAGIDSEILFMGRLLQP
jgi:serpin B